jgi:hypothetical protein
MVERAVAKIELDRLYNARTDAVVFVDVPDLAYVMVDGRGRPDGQGFQEAVAVLFGLSYAMHIAVRKAAGAAHRVLPHEALWWIDGDGGESWEDVEPERWRWTAMMVQPEPINRAHFVAAVDQMHADKPDVHVERARFERWREGSAAQTMHVGPYDDEASSLRRLREAIVEAGTRPCGHHHEIYLGDPRRSAPQNLRTILRQPVLPMPAYARGADGARATRPG